MIRQNNKRRHVTVTKSAHMLVLTGPIVFPFLQPSLTSPFLVRAGALCHAVSQVALWPLTAETCSISVITTAMSSPVFPYDAAEEKCLFLDASALTTCWLCHIDYELSDLADVAVSFGRRPPTYLNFLFIFLSQLRWQMAEDIGLWFVNQTFYFSQNIYF